MPHELGSDNSDSKVIRTTFSVKSSNSDSGSTHSRFHSQKDSTIRASAHPKKALIVIDPGVEDYQTLAAGAIAGATVAILDADRNGIEQITELLETHSDIHSLHLVSHGAPGCLYLGNAQLTLETVDRYAWDLQNWFTVSAPTLLLYGCHVGAEAVGKRFMNCLHQLTGAAIAASTTYTGNAALGGNWDLEVSLGKVETPIAFDAATMAAYNAVFGASARSTCRMQSQLF